MATTHTPTFGELLRHYRLAAGLTMEEPAERAGLSAKGIGELERGERRTPRRDTVSLLAGALQLPPAERAVFEAAARRPRVNGTLVPAASAVPYVRDLPVPNSLPLPIPLTPLIGREREEAAIIHLLQQPDVRLLTLTGPAGIGKTRLALQVAAALAAEEAAERDPLFPDGVVFVALAAVREPALVPSTVAQALSVREGGRHWRTPSRWPCANAHSCSCSTTSSRWCQLVRP